MSKQKRTTSSKVAVFSLLALGSGLVAVSAFCTSSFLAILGVAVMFWDAMLLFLAPSRHVPLSLLNASVEAGNIERILAQTRVALKGVYLPAENMRSIESCLVFIPKTLDTPLPRAEENNGRLLTEKEDGVFITPPGAALLRLFERELGKSFSKVDLAALPMILPRLLIEDLELVETAEVHTGNSTITVRVTGSVLDTICRETDNRPRTHEQVGCLLSSALGCALAKTTGKPVTIQEETRDPQTRITTITYHVE